MANLLDTLSTGEDLNSGDINRVDGGAIVGKKTSQGTANDFGSVDDSDGLAKQSVAGSQDRVVDLEVLQNLDNRKGRARKNGLLAVLRGVQESNIVIHVVNVLMSKTLDVLGELDCLLDILVVGGVLGEDGVVDDHPIYVLILIGLHNLLFENLLVDIAKVKLEAAMSRISRWVKHLTRFELRAMTYVYM